MVMGNGMDRSCHRADQLIGGTDRDGMTTQGVAPVAPNQAYANLFHRTKTTTLTTSPSSS